MEPFFFGTPPQSLFGIYHEPERAGRPAYAVVLCHPLGHEYINSHRALRQMALRLAKLGFPVLRFDLSGCGDSNGDFEEAAVRQWIADLAVAIDEVRARSGLARVCLVGLRLGASLAAMLGVEQGAVARMVLWDPVVNGRAYLQEMTNWSQRKLPYLLAKQKPLPTAAQYTEVFGFPLSDGLIADLEAVDLLQPRGKPAEEVLLISGTEAARAEQLAAHLKSNGVPVLSERILDHEIWLEEPHKLLVPNRVLQAIVSWISTSTQ